MRDFIEKNHFISGRNGTTFSWNVAILNGIFIRQEVKLVHNSLWDYSS